MKRGITICLIAAGASVLLAGCGHAIEKMETASLASGTISCSGERKEYEEKVENGSVDAEQKEAENGPDIGREAGKKENETKAGRDAGQRLADTKAQIGWESGKKRELGEIQTLLEDAEITYAGYYNITEERLDLELEDGTDLVFLELSNEYGENGRYELVLDGDGNLNESGFQEGYLHHYDVIIDDKFYPDAGERFLTENELWGMNATDLSIVRNEIYAVHGRIFNDPFLNAVFRTKSWYEPLYTADEFEEKASAFTEIEKENIKAVQEHEELIKNRIRVDGKSLDTKKKLLSGSWIDLDGDGKKEQIVYEITQESDSLQGRYCLTVNGSERSDDMENPYSHLEVVELDETAILLSAGCDGPSDDPWSDYYIYKDQELVFLGGIPGELRGFSDGILYVTAQCDFFQSNRLVFPYRFSGEEQLVLDDSKKFYEYGNQAVAKETIPLYRDQLLKETGITLNPGDVVTILGSDLYHGVQVQKEEDGGTGWIRYEPGYGCILPDGREMQSWELFEGLPFFG